VDGAGVIHRCNEAQAPAAARAGEDIDVEGPLHQVRPGPVAGARPRGRTLAIGGTQGGGYAERGGIGAWGGHDTRAPAGMGSRYILLRDRKKSPSTTAGTHSTARLPA